MTAPDERAARMNAYYYGFARTGDEMIDRILSAIACAGKAFHHTDQWNDEVYDLRDGQKVAMPYEPFLRGMTPVEWIQNAAEDAVATQAQRRKEAVLAERRRIIALAREFGTAATGALADLLEQEDHAEG